MRKFVGYAAGIACLLSLFMIPFACMRDKATYTYTLRRPVLKTLAEVRANMKSGTPQPVVNPGKMYVWGKYVFLNEIYKGIHIIDVGEPAHPKNMGFIPIPGNLDMSVSGNALYAGSYSDLAALDISDPLHISAKAFVDKAFPDLYAYVQNGNNPDSVLVVADWINKDTTVPYDGTVITPYTGCSLCGAASFTPYAAAASASTTGSNGAGGSMSRFTVVNNYLYTVSYSQLNVFDVHAAFNPALAGNANLQMSTGETVYPFNDKLFVGSTAGMYVFDINATPDKPFLLGEFSHVRACDPVISDGKYAYVTLSDGSRCQGYEDELQILDVGNLADPSLSPGGPFQGVILVQSYPMKHPEGLAKDGNLLFICDGKAGLKVFDATDVSHLGLKSQITSCTPYEVILINQVAFVAAQEGLFLYDYHDPSAITLIGKL
jgi:hypothetical protein